MEITCISCPVGCRMSVEVDNGTVLSVKGNMCPRGARYANQEAIAPKRIITAVLTLQNSDTPLPIKTEDGVPKSDIFKCMAHLNSLKLYAPIKLGDIICENICGSGVRVVATSSVLK